MDGRTLPTSEHCYQWSVVTEAIQEDVAEAIIDITDRVVKQPF